MIESKVLNLLRLRVPNYHIVSEKFANGNFSICTCGKCRNCLKMTSYGTTEKDGEQQLYCEWVYNDLMKMGCYGHARVNEFGTCDAAQFIPEDYSKFAIEQQKLLEADGEVPTAQQENEGANNESE